MDVLPCPCTKNSLSIKHDKQIKNQSGRDKNQTNNRLEIRVLLLNVAIKWSFSWGSNFLLENQTLDTTITMAGEQTHEIKQQSNTL